MGPDWLFSDDYLMALPRLSLDAHVCVDLFG